MEEYVWSLRAYLLARDIREQYIGGDTVDAATIYNNLGCCMCSLKRYISIYHIHRNQEAQAYFKLAHAIFELLLGALHERTMTVLYIYIYFIGKPKHKESQENGLGS